MAADLTVAVAGFIETAAVAVRREDPDSAIRCLNRAVDLYKVSRTEVHDPQTQLQTLLEMIQSVVSLCKRLRRPADDLGALQARANALRVA